MNSASPNKILVVGPNWVGDMVMAQSLFMVLLQDNPGVRIDVLAPAWTLPVLDYMPEVYKGLGIPLKRGELGIGTRYRLSKSLASEAYDQVILLPNSLKSALIPFFAEIPRRTGFLGEQRWGLLTDVRRLDKRILRQTVQRFVALAGPVKYSAPPDCPVPRLIVANEEIRRTMDGFSIDDVQGNVLILCPGAEYGPAKRWPVGHYASLANDRVRHGWNVWLLGSQKDQEVCQLINEETGGHCRNYAGKTSLSEAITLMSVADAVVSNDSGLMHIAAALDRNLVALYGSSDPGFTPPLTPKARILRLGLDCSPCFKRECPLGHLHCLTELLPERVISALEAI
jgi:heptosyltransferase-2